MLVDNRPETEPDVREENDDKGYDDAPARHRHLQVIVIVKLLPHPLLSLIHI